MGLSFFISKNIKHNIQEGVVFLHYITTDNVGDISCCPKKYFKDFKKCKELEIFDYKLSDKDKIIIIGGGGLLQEYFKTSIENIIRNGKDKIIIFWGAGLDNSPTGEIFDTQILSSCKLIGIRDYNTQYRYIPCVSCMSNFFDKYRKNTPKKKIRCYIHSSYDFPEFLISSYESYMNNQNSKDKDSMKKALKFMSEAEYIITNSFHGVYWATLLNRKVIALPFTKDGHTKFSDKFMTIKYKPVYVHSFNDIKNNLDEILKKAKNYEEALIDSRKINISFYKEVIDIINRFYKS